MLSNLRRPHNRDLIFARSLLSGNHVICVDLEGYLRLRSHETALVRCTSKTSIGTLVAA